MNKELINYFIDNCFNHSFIKEIFYNNLIKKSINKLNLKLDLDTIAQNETNAYNVLYDGYLKDCICGKDVIKKINLNNLIRNFKKSNITNSFIVFFQSFLSCLNPYFSVNDLL